MHSVPPVTTPAHQWSVWSLQELWHSCEASSRPLHSKCILYIYTLEPVGNYVQKHPVIPPLGNYEIPGHPVPWNPLEVMWSSHLLEPLGNCVRSHPLENIIWYWLYRFEPFFSWVLMIVSSHISGCNFIAHRKCESKVIIGCSLRLEQAILHHDKQVEDVERIAAREEVEVKNEKELELDKPPNAVSPHAACIDTVFPCLKDHLGCLP